MSGSSQGRTMPVPAPAFSAPGSLLSPEAQICAYSLLVPKRLTLHIAPRAGLVLQLDLPVQGWGTGLPAHCQLCAIIPGDLSPSHEPARSSCSFPRDGPAVCQPCQSSLPPLPRDSSQLCSSFAQTLNECFIQPGLQVAQGNPGAQRPGDAFPALRLVSPSPDLIGSLSANLTSPF